MRGARRRGGPLIAMALLVACALWTWLLQIQGLPQALSSPIPAAFDRFEAAICRLTPSTAAVEVAGDPAVLVFERSVTGLYPRPVYSAVDTSYMHAHPPLRLSWPALLRAARRDGARYIFVWLPSGDLGRPPARVILVLRRAPGLLVAVP